MRKFTLVVLLGGALFYGMSIATPAVANTSVSASKTSLTMNLSQAKMNSRTWNVNKRAGQWPLITNDVVESMRDLHDAGYYPEGIELYRKYPEMNELPETRNVAGLALSGWQKSAEAIENFETAAQSLRRRLADTYANQGFQGSHAESISYEPKLYKIQCYYSHNCYYTNKIRELSNQLESPVYANLIAAHVKQGNFADAEQLALEAQRLEPHWAVTYFSTSKILTEYMPISRDASLPKKHGNFVNMNDLTTARAARIVTSY